MGIRFFVPLAGPFYYTPGRKHPKRPTKSASESMQELNDTLAAMEQRRDARHEHWRNVAHGTAHELDIHHPDDADRFIRHYVAQQRIRRGVVWTSAILTVLLIAVPWLLLVTAPLWILTALPVGRAWFTRRAYKRYLSGKPADGPPVNVCACDTMV